MLKDRAGADSRQIDKELSIYTTWRRALESALCVSKGPCILGLNASFPLDMLMGDANQGNERLVRDILTRVPLFPFLHFLNITFLAHER